MIEGLELLNVGRFVGEHALSFKGLSYAINASYEVDPKRSNAAGKSFLLETIRYAVDGKFPDFRKFDADGWISHGEKHGKIVLHLEGGVSISREKTRGKGNSVQVRFSRHGSSTASQDDASAAILEHYGFAKGDFVNTVWIEQRGMATMLHEDPAPRLKIVSAWFGLGLATQAEKALGVDLGALGDRVEEFVAKRRVLEGMQEAALQEAALSDEYLAERERGLLEEIEEYRAKIASISSFEAAKKVLADRDADVAKIKTLKNEVDALLFVEADFAAAKIASEDLEQKSRAARSDYETKSRTAEGAFDGACPVAKLQCPLTVQINTDRTASRKLVVEAEKVLASARDEARKARGVYDDLTAVKQRVDVKQREIERLKKLLRDRVEEIRTSTATVSARRETSSDDHHENDVEELSLEVLDELCEKRRQDLADTKATRRGLAVTAAAKDTRAKEIARLDDEIAQMTTLSLKVAKARACVKMGARRVAERNLATIEHDANAALSRTGVPLSVTARWEYEGKDLARSCDECGASFPASAKVKECQRCGVPRGKNVTQQLDFVPSDSSGAYDDLAGGTIRLAAAEWFLRSKQSAWSTVALDEPFAHCDPVSRRGLSLYLGQMVRASNVFRQAFVVSHSADAADACQGRIDILVRADGSRAIKVSS